MTEATFADLRETHAHEEKLRAESLRIIEADPELAKRLSVVEKAMALIFAYVIDHSARTEDERTLQMLGIRLFNATASGIKLALSGYYQTAFAQARDIMETGFLLDLFRTYPEKIPIWTRADRQARNKMFLPVKVRTALDARDGEGEKNRAKQYEQLSELASHATYRGFRLTTRQGFGELGPFVETINLKAWLHEMVLRLGPSAVIFANLFRNADSSLEHFLQEFGTELLEFKSDHR